ncbi:hypothetical protein [Shewanella algae]|uniref:ApeA N-terminal domain 1-containing protein n=1 Tax=Shewanella algae TaxID=38313 RepID=UPI003004558E
MRKQDLRFSEDKDIKVKLKIDCFDRDIHGTLKLRDKKLPKLEFDSLSGIGIGAIHLTESEKNLITCQSEMNTYILLRNEILADDIWPRYLIHGNSKEDIYGVEILISGLSEWIDQETYFDISETEIKKDRPKPSFNEKIEINGERYQIRSNYNCLIEKKDNRDFLVSETTTVSLVNSERAIELEEAENLAYRVKSFFSLLLAAPLSIESAWLLNEDTKKKKPFYFSTPGDNPAPYEKTIECLINPVRILKDIGWKSLFDNYFSSEKKEVFENIWVRLPYLLSYPGTWDYEILGYVSTLDSYCNEFSSKNGKKLGKAQYKRLKQDLVSIVDKYSVELGEDFKEVFNSFKTGISGMRNTNMPTFREKYDFMIEKVDQDIRQIVAFSPTEFSVIKKIRDSAAHGLPIETRDGRDISYEFGLKDKLIVLLFYLVYRDFGISPVEYAKSLKYTFSKFVRNSGIDCTKRDKLAGTVPFWNVDEVSFNLAKNSKRFYVGVEFDSSVQQFKFSSSVTSECQTWLSHRKPENRNLIEYIKKKLFLESDVDIEYVNQVYLVYGEESIELSAVCKVSY